MKTLILIPILLGFVLNIQAQRIVEERHEINSDQSLRIEFDFADDIIINKWDKNEVYVKATVTLNDGEHNDNFKFNVVKNSRSLSIVSEIEDMNKISRECSTIIIEDGDTTYINGNRVQWDLYFEVYIPDHIEFDVETINGDIALKGLSGPMEISTINGDIDLFIPKTLQADLTMETINGTMYTNMDLEILQKKEGLCRIRGDVESKLNGGGPEISLSTINGTMYLREL